MGGGANYVHRMVNIQKLNFLELRNMLFDYAQSYTAFKSSYRLSQSATFPTPEYSLVSSAKLTSLDTDTSVSISDMIIKNRRGPKRFPVGHHLIQGGLH